MQHFRKIVAACLAGTLMSSVMIGCGSNNADTKTDAGIASNNKGKVSEKPITLTYWTTLNGSVSTTVSDLSQVGVYKELEKRTNVKIKFKHPPQGQGQEQLNIMIASGDLPDFIETDWSAYPGAEQKASEDKIIIETTDLVNKYAPNFKKIMDENPQTKRWVATRDKYYIFPNIMLNKKYSVLSGPLMRKDLLDELHLQVPETIDEWETVLKAFKQKGIKYPLSFIDTDKSSHIKGWHLFVGAYGITRQLYVDNGKIKYGYLEPQMKDFISLMSRWIKEGLVDPDVAMQDGKTLTAKVLSEQVAAFPGNLGGDMGNSLNSMKTKNPKFDLVAVPYPTLKKGDTSDFLMADRIDGYTYAGEVAITTSNKHPVESVKWLDYAYSNQGRMLYNFGIEGESYKMENDIPKYTDLITKNTEGLSMAQSLSKYARPTAAGIMDERYLEQYYQLPQQRAAAALWSKNAELNEKADKSVMWRACIKMNAEEAKEYNQIMSNIDTFVTEKYTKFLFGVNGLEGYDQFVQDLKKKNIERAIEIWQTAYDRVMKK